ncbi:MAG: pyruvate formate lyase family protein [Smithellaceae bacterium]|nr:pyruvate formate lyase family protein [Smithellaceae bacterium]
METAQNHQLLRLQDDSPDERQSTHTGRLNVLKIQRTCVHDGPGIRTTIFFRGCRLRCLWCQNPEALSFHPGPVPDENYSIPDIIELVSRDKDYYHQTNGGVTMSGGDPLLQDPDTLMPLLEPLRRENIHVAVETSLHVPWENIEKLAPCIDLFLVDLKVVGDDILHKKYTGQDSKIIRDNIGKLIALNARIKFRMLMVPGYNDGESRVTAAADLLKSVCHDSIELLKYHRMYEEKARRLGLSSASLNITDDQSLASVKEAVLLFKSFGIKAECYDLDTPRHKAAFSRRVYDIQNAIRESGRSLCFEASRLKTDYYKKHGFKKPTPIHRAERLSYVLKNKSVIIYPRELLVGNFTARRCGGQIWEEHYGVLFASILHQIHRQKPVPFKCSWKERFDFFYRTLPFWLKHCLLMKVNNSFSGFMLTMARSSENVAGFNNNMAAFAHFTVNFERMLELGTTGIIREIQSVQKEKPGNTRDFYKGAVIALQALEAFAARYAESLSRLRLQEADPERRKELEEMAAICSHVPKYPARTYHEALQSMLFLQIAICTESYENAISHGRLDQVLYPYYKKDKETGILDYDKAKELLALYILKMDEAILVNDGDTYLRIGRLFETMSTDQGVTAGGLDRDGMDATNDVTYMLLDICELQPYACNMTARIHKDSPTQYLDRLAEVYINGAPMPALYNDEIYLETLKKHYPSTPAEDARNYAIIGCVEPNVSDDHFGNTDCANVNVALPFLQALKGEEDDLWNIGFIDQLEKMTTKFFEYNCRRDNQFSRYVLSKYMLARNRFKKRRTAAPRPPANMEELLRRFQVRLNHLTNSILADHQNIEKVIRENFTTPLSSSLFKGCIESGKDLCEGGATINSSGIQAVGITDVADSLFAIDEVVYTKKLYSIQDVINAVNNNFAGRYFQKVRSALLEVPKFGHDGSHEAVEWVNKTLQIYINALNSVANCPRGGIYAAGYYALNVNDVYGKKTPALPSGRLSGVSLANSVTPHYGMQTADLLSSLNAVAGVDFVNYAPNGTTVTFTVDSALFQGTDGVRNLSGIIRTYFNKGGMQFQPNVIDRQILLDAYDNPGKYPHLLVRVAGYCSYFNDLSDDLKKIIINRTCYR